MDKWQTVKNMIRCHVLWHLTWVHSLLRIFIPIIRVNKIMHIFFQTRSEASSQGVHVPLFSKNNQTCFLKVIFKISMFPVIRLVCSLKIFANVPLFSENNWACSLVPKTPWEALRSICPYFSYSFFFFFL